MANDSYLIRKGFDPYKIKEEFFGKGSMLDMTFILIKKWRANVVQKRRFR